MDVTDETPVPLYVALRSALRDVADGRYDDLDADALAAFTRLDPVRQARTRAGLGLRGSWAVIGWARTSATVAVRTGDPELVVLGLVALSLFDPGAVDSREAWLIYPLLTRAAEKLGEDPRALVTRAAKLSDEPGREFLLGRRETRVTAEQMGFREVGDGPTFEFEDTREHFDPRIELADWFDDAR